MKNLNWKAVSLALISISAVGAKPAMAQEVYLQGGTQGGGIGGAVGVTSWLGVHADIDGFNVSHSFHAGDNKFDGQLHVRHAGLYADVFPFSNSGFRITAGALFNRDRLQGVAVPENGVYKLNGISIPAAAVSQAPTVNAQFPTVMPYLGLGYGHQPAHKGFGFVADIGVAYGKPSVSFSGTGTLQQVAPEQLAEEENSIRNSIQHYKIYPIVQIGVSYRF